MDGMLVHRSVIPSIKFAGTSFINLGGERHCESSVLSENPTQCPQPGLEPGPRDPEASEIKMKQRIFEIW